MHWRHSPDYLRRLVLVQKGRVTTRSWHWTFTCPFILLSIVLELILFINICIYQLQLSIRFQTYAVMTNTSTQSELRFSVISTRTSVSTEFSTTVKPRII